MNELERTALNEVLRTVTYIVEKKGERDDERPIKKITTNSKFRN